MVSKAEARDLIDGVFEEEALVIGGLVAVHGMDDDIVWRLIKSLNVIRGTTLRRLEDTSGRDEAEPEHRSPNVKLHPAIEGFLLSLRRS